MPNFDQSTARALAEEALELADAATLGPWEYCDEPSGASVGMTITWEGAYADGAFIADARTRVPALAGALLAALDREARVREHLKFHKDLALECELHGTGDYPRGRAYGIRALAEDIEAALATGRKATP
jgi:hypothetical protein